MSDPTIIVHLSDLHLGGQYFVPEWGDKVVELVNQINPEVLVITGDLTTEGYLYEYQQVKDYLTGFAAIKNRIVVPGNHDARNEGYVIFEEIFGTRYPSYENENLALLGIDSSEPDIDDGHIGRANYPMIISYFNNRNKIRIIAMHHHLVPIPGTGRERHIPKDAGDVLKLCLDLDIRLVLSGHKHLPWIWRLENTWLITGGTATSRRLKGRTSPSFNIITIGEQELVISEVDVATGRIALARKTPLAFGKTQPRFSPR